MAYKTILLCLNEIERVPQLIAAARQLGVKFNAHIAGLYVIPGVRMFPTDGYGAPMAVYEGAQTYFKDQLPKIREAFEHAMTEDKISFDLRVVNATQPIIATDVLDHCYSADLVVVSSGDRKADANIENDFVEQIVLAAGRPVLLLPFKGKTEINFDDVMLSWNNSRESARAAFDALAFMQRAKRTKIAIVDASQRGQMEGANIAETMDRNGVKCEIVNVVSTGSNVGETLLRTAHEQGSGLLILGAYGHTRLTEWVFGGATRHVLRHFNLPILMSH
ncbi:MAG: universal stress protein [Alphaproteobacteria bacterium]|nr:universal stress protein [Alphaproteobacteria bacterium]